MRTVHRDREPLPPTRRSSFVTRAWCRVPAIAGRRVSAFRQPALESNVCSARGCPSGTTRSRDPASIDGYGAVVATIGARAARIRGAGCRGTRGAAPDHGRAPRVMDPGKGHAERASANRRLRESPSCEDRLAKTDRRRPPMKCRRDSGDHVRSGSSAGSRSRADAQRDRSRRPIRSSTRPPVSPYARS